MFTRRSAFDFVISPLYRIHLISCFYPPFALFVAASSHAGREDKFLDDASYFYIFTSKTRIEFKDVFSYLTGAYGRFSSWWCEIV